MKLHPFLMVPLFCLFMLISCSNDGTVEEPPINDPVPEEPMENGSAADEEPEEETPETEGLTVWEN